MCCDLEIDVNGQGTFLVSKKIIACYSGRLRKLFGKSTEKASSLKVIFHDFPGGAEAFELILQFCYNGGRVNVSPCTVLLLHSAAAFMEMDEVNCSFLEEFLKGIRQMAWPGLLECLKQCQELGSFISSEMLQELLDCLVGRLSLCSVLSPYSSSSTESSFLQFSGDLSRESISNYSSQTSNSWFEDLDFLKIDIIEKLVKTMVSKNVDKDTVSRFLFHYQRMKFSGNVTTGKAEKRRITETVINLLCLLDKSLMSLKFLLYNLQFSLALKLRKCHRRKLESLIGCILDSARLDDLLLPSPPGKGYRYAYDVNLILRLQKQFLLESRKKFLMYRMKKVAFLMDSYIAEVAPDPCLQPAKFVALATALPAVSRDSHDRIYQAVDVYLKVHEEICVEEKIEICGILDYNKLSVGCLLDLAHNMNFPACSRVNASKLRVIPRKIGCVRTFKDSKSRIPL